MENEDVRKTAYELAAELHEKRSNLAKEIYQKEMTAKIHAEQVKLFGEILKEKEEGGEFKDGNKRARIWEALGVLYCADYSQKMILQDIIEGLQRRINGLQLEIDGLKVEFSEL